MWLRMLARGRIVRSGSNSFDALAPFLSLLASPSRSVIPLVSATDLYNFPFLIRVGIGRHRNSSPPDCGGYEEACYLNLMILRKVEPIVDDLDRQIGKAGFLGVDLEFDRSEPARFE